MRVRKMLGVAGAVLFAASLMAGAKAATITGTVKSPEGTAFEGAFVQAMNTKTHMTFMALSDPQGHYRIVNIMPGEYRVGIRAVGFRADAQTGVNLADTDSKSLDFSLQKGTVRWNDISIDQARALLPPAEGKTVLFTRCFICHGFQSRMAAVQRDADGWKDRVQYMRDAMHFSLSWRLTDQNANDVASYLDSVFGTEATLTRSPADLAGYKDTVLKFTPDAYKINYVEYDMPGPSRMPFSAAPGKDGYLWIPDFGVANKITRLDPKTGAMEDFPVPNVGTAAVHSAYQGPDGAVWLTEQASNKLGRWDPDTKKITEYQDPYAEGKEGTEPGGSKHTVRLDPHGNAWATGDPLSRFDPETGKFTNYWESGRTYSLTNDTEGNIWFTITTEPAALAKMDWKTLKMTKYPLPSKNGYPRRLAIDSKDVIWFGEYDTGKLGRFDMKTEKFKEYDLPTGPLTHPYGLGLDKDENIWYSSYYFDVLVKFDPKTEKFTQYPFPHSENTIRELFLDKDGKMWYGTPANNKVGYFYLTGTAGSGSTRGGQ